MPHFLENCTVKRSTNKHTYVVCRPEHICHLFFHTKILLFLPEIQNFASAYIHTRPMPHFLENRAVQRSTNKHTYVVCRRKQAYILCFCIKNIFFLPEIQNFAPAYIHTRPMPQFLRILVMKIYQKNHTYVVCRRTHICYLFFRTKMLVFLPRVWPYEYIYILTQIHTGVTVCENHTLHTSTNKHTYVVCRHTHICYLFFRTKMLVFLPRVWPYEYIYILTQIHTGVTVCENHTLHTSTNKHTYVVCRCEQAYILCFCIKNLFFLPRVWIYEYTYVHWFIQV
jgi:hypothetical protein